MTLRLNKAFLLLIAIRHLRQRGQSQWYLNGICEICLFYQGPPVQNLLDAIDNTAKI